VRLFLWRYAAGLYRIGALSVLAGAALALFVHIPAGAVIGALGLAVMSLTHRDVGA
jgi:hypothetical protein